MEENPILFVLSGIRTEETEIEEKVPFQASQSDHRLDVECLSQTPPHKTSRLASLIPPSLPLYPSHLFVLPVPLFLAVLQ